MSETRTQRRLAAILAADVEGYSQMMGADEAGTLVAMRSVWGDVFNPIVAAHRGRIFKTMGDAALVEFGSAVDAVECAAAVQAAMAARVAGDGPDIALRIGINLGDVVSDGDDMLGDGVNVAARLEAQAPRGGILIADAIHAQVRGKVRVAFIDAGELSLKNIAIPVRAWRWGDGQSAAVAAPVAEDLPSIAVLPFTNMSGDPEQEYFSDGISEDIITDLSKLGGLTVIARNSSFVYKGQTVDIRAVGRDLGVTSVLEGSIRRAGNRVRITAQLIDARNGAHLWADRYDRDLTDIFAVQDEVTLQIVGALKVHLRPAERQRLAGTRATNVAAHDAFLRGRQLAADLPAVSGDRRAFDAVIAAYTRAIQIDPAFAAPHAGMSLAYIIDHANRWGNAPDPLALAAREADLAIAKDPGEALGHVAAAVVHLYQGDVPAMKRSADRAIELAPNSASAIGIRGNAEMMLGNAEGAIPWLQRSIRLDKDFAKQGLHFLGSAQLLAGRYAEAAETLRERIRQVPSTDLSRSLLASALGHLGQIDEARRIWAGIAAVNPDYSLDRHLGRLTYSNPADPARIREGLAKAGLP